MATHDRTPTSGDREHNALVHAKDLDNFKVPEGQPDPRGWSVKTADGTTLGKVEDLLFDTSVERIRYIEVRTDGDIKKQGGRDYFLLPIGTARLDDDADDVVVNMSASELTGVPVYDREKMSREYESSLRDYVRDRPGSRATTSGIGSGSTERDVNFYGSPEYDDSSFFSRGRNPRTGIVDDIKDRFDGNPASRPGPDATDRRL